MTERTARRISWLLLAFAVMAPPTLAPQRLLAQPPDTGGISFDWTMPARYGGDADGDGITDFFGPGGTLEISPDGYQVDFLASACVGATFRWLIEGREVVAGSPDGCHLSYRFAKEGTYDVRIEARDGHGDLLASATRIVVVQDFLIVSIGDSVASGEGNPDFGSSSLWQNKQCHRSANAGPARAARALEDGDPRTSVTFVHLACSGATILAGLLGEYAGIEPTGQKLPPQVEEIRELIGDREIDALLVSIGANDVHFSSVLKRCLLDPRPCHSGLPGTGSALFNALLPRLPSNYDSLDRTLGGTLDITSVKPERVYLTEYFDPTRDEARQPCDRTILADHPAAAAGAAQRLAITAEEAGWASNVMLTSLNAEVAAAASRHGWTFVGGINGAFQPHGYCSLDSWIVFFQQSKENQGDEFGTLHPNGFGHDVYADRLRSSIATDLYVDRNVLSPRRRPEQRVEVQGQLGSGPFEDVVRLLHAGESVTVRARVNGKNAQGRTLAFLLEGHGALSAASGFTDSNGEAFATYQAPDPLHGETDRVRVMLVEEDGTTHEDSVGLFFDVSEPAPPPPPPPPPDCSKGCTYRGFVWSVSDGRRFPTETEVTITNDKLLWDCYGQYGFAAGGLPAVDDDGHFSWRAVTFGCSVGADRVTGTVTTTTLEFDFVVTYYDPPVQFRFVGTRVP